MAANTTPRPPVLPAQLTLLQGSEAALQIYQAAAREDPLEQLQLKNADLCGEVLQHAVFRGCVLENCRFASADLTRAAFTDCVLKNCDFSGARKLFLPLHTDRLQGTGRQFCRKPPV